MKAATAEQQVSDWIQHFAQLLSAPSPNSAAVSELFNAQCWWRDLLAFTWNVHTAEGLDAIGQQVAATAEQAQAQNFAVTEPATVDNDDITAWFNFDTRAGVGTAKLVLRGERCRVLFTTLRSLHGFAETSSANGNRDRGVHHGALKQRVSWLEAKQIREAKLGRSEQPFCLIIGGGQGGLGLAARLQRLNVPTIVLEKHARAGDSWRNRYRTLCLHDPVWYDHMPDMPFPDHWPVFSPKDKLGDWLEMYAKVMELNFWGSSECLGASFDEQHQRWDVRVRRQGEIITLQPKQLVLATGMSGFARIPSIAGAAQFRGEQCHSSDYRSGAPYAGKRCVVIGANTSAHDICADLWESGADVTMVQRSPTIVARSESLQALSWGPLYSEEAIAQGLTTDRADLIGQSTPYGLGPERQIPMNAAFKQRDADMYAGLEAAGFLFDFGEDETGIGGAYPRRGGGYYIEVGASQLIIDGHIKLKNDAAIECISETGVHFSDGSERPADLIIYATGYGPMNEWARALISIEVAERVGRCWGLGSDTKGDPGPWEGELRNMWKPTQQSGLWFHGGNLMQSRFYSRTVALQLKARYEGLQTPVYGLAPVHHRE